MEQPNFFKAMWPTPTEWIILLLIAIAGSLGII
jgi:Flp pilus assembly protein TadB